MVRNWFVDKNDSAHENCYSLDDTIGDILKSEDILGMVSGVAGSLVRSPLMALVKPFTLRQVLSLNKFLKIDESMIEMAEQFLSTVKKVN